MADAPIEKQDFLGGVKVVDIGDLRVARGLSRRPYSGCRHFQLIYDQKERRIWCEDCETTIEAFDAFEILVTQYDRAVSDIKRRQTKIDEAESDALISLAAREIDKAWRRKHMVPACPTCGSGLFPEDFKNGIRASLGRDYATAMRKKKQDEKAARTSLKDPTP